jgi:flagellar motor switch protein FliN/FliY
MTEESMPVNTPEMEAAPIQPQEMIPEMEVAPTSQYSGNGREPSGINLSGGSQANIEMLMDVKLLFTVELGRTQMTVRQVLDLQKGSVVELERVAGDPVDIYINDRLLGHGEVVVVDDKFGVRITELVTPEDAQAA